MKSFYLVSAVLAVAGTTLATNCTPGQDYCGHALLALGNYQPLIDQCLYDNNVNPVDNGKSVLFACQGGANGVVKFVKQCVSGRCSDHGPAKTDICF